MGGGSGALFRCTDRKLLPDVTRAKANFPYEEMPYELDIAANSPHVLILTGEYVQTLRLK